MLTSLLKENSLSPSIQIMSEKNKKNTKKLEDFKFLFSDIPNIKGGDKIGRTENKYYIQSSGMFQKFHRWWNNENRKKTFKDLDNDFSKFLQFCDSIKEENYINKNMINNIISLVNKIIPGLYNLKTTYKDSPKGSDGNKLMLKIDSIILTLIDLKEEINLSLNNNNINKTVFKMRTLSF